jgi:hypothetical protein
MINFVIGAACWVLGAGAFW